MSGSISQFTKGNYMLAGDSAGMVLPSNGAGITTAMIGGRVAGQAIANHINNGDSLDEYEANWNKQMGKMMKYSKRGIKWGEIMFNSPDWLVDASFNSLFKTIHLAGSKLSACTRNLLTYLMKGLWAVVFILDTCAFLTQKHPNGECITVPGIKAEIVNKQSKQY